MGPDGQEGGELTEQARVLYASPGAVAGWKQSRIGIKVHQILPRPCQRPDWELRPSEDCVHRSRDHTTRSTAIAGGMRCKEGRGRLHGTPHEEQWPQGKLRQGSLTALEEAEKRCNLHPWKHPGAGWRDKLGTVSSGLILP